MSKITMRVAGIAVDPASGQPILVLKDDSGKLNLPIWLSIVEANAVAAILSGDGSAPHTLIGDVVRAMGGRIKAVVIDEADGDSFYATVEVAGPTDEVAVKAEAADAVALALSEEIPIEAASDLLLSAKFVHETKQGDEGGDEGGGDGGGESSLSDKMRELLEDLSPDDFGKYRM